MVATGFGYDAAVRVAQAAVVARVLPAVRDIRRARRRGARSVLDAPAGASTRSTSAD